MMNPTDGSYRMLAATDLDAARAELEAARRATGEDLVLVEGTEDQIAGLSKRVRLGNVEVEKRRARRRMQAESRRRNR